MSKILTSDRREETVSMLIGLAVVGIVVFLIFNFIQRRKGSISLPGISQQNEEIQKPVEKMEVFDNYNVKKGDNLWKIASTIYGDGYKWGLIARENNLKNPGQIEVGQKLVVPTLTSQQKETPKIPSEYKVIKGDSLWKIAVIYFKDGFRWVEIWKLNKEKIMNPDRLEIGMTLRLR